jgi:hypothetical protein
VAEPEPPPVSNVIVIEPIPSPVVSAYSGADPYVYPINGPAYKLPNAYGVYRLYQDDNVVINAQVEQASDSILETITAVTDRLQLTEIGLTPISKEAYFYTKLFLANRHDPMDQVVLDLTKKTVVVTTGGATTTGSSFIVGTAKIMHSDEPIPFTTDVHQSHVSIPVHWNDVCLSVIYTNNPQIRNGLRLSGPQTTLAGGTGLLLRNYKPKLFSVRSLKDMRPVNVTNCKFLTQRGIKMQSEVHVQCSA